MDPQRILQQAFTVYQTALTAYDRSVAKAAAICDAERRKYLRKVELIEQKTRKGRMAAADAKAAIELAKEEFDKAVDKQEAKLQRLNDKLNKTAQVLADAEKRILGGKGGK